MNKVQLSLMKRKQETPRIAMGLNIYMRQMRFLNIQDRSATSCILNAQVSLQNQTILSIIKHILASCMYTPCSLGLFQPCPSVTQPAMLFRYKTKTSQKQPSFILQINFSDLLDFIKRYCSSCRISAASCFSCARFFLLPHVSELDGDSTSQ